MVDNAYYTWVSLFTQDTELAWKNESVQDLKTTAMLLCALKTQFDSIQNVLQKKFNNFRTEFTPQVKDNENDLLCTEEQLNQAISVADSSSFDSELTPVEHSLPLASESPKINRTKKILHLKKSHREKQLNNCTPPTKNCLKHVDESLNTYLNKNDDETCWKPESSLDTCYSLNLMNPVAYKYNCSPDIIESTPKPVRSKSNSALSFKKSNKPKKKKSQQSDKTSYSTLTQMFPITLSNTPKKCEKDNSTTQLNSPDETESLMEIDDILEHISRESKKSSTEEKKFSTEKSRSSGQKISPRNKENLMPLPIRKIIDSSFARNYDQIPEKKSKDVNYVYKEEPVRGKARMQLPGWSCNDCKEFYEALDLSPRKLKEKMDACSKHRSKFPPQYDTPKGFWDIATPQI